MGLILLGYLSDVTHIQSLDYALSPSKAFSSLNTIG